MYQRMVLLAVVLVGCLWVLGCESTAPPPDERTTSPTQHTQRSALPEKWAEHAQGLPFIAGYEEGRRVSESQNRPAMMFVTTTWCGWCKKLADDDFNDPEIRKLLENFVCVVVDGDTERQAIRQLGATGGFPTIVFLSPGGERLGGCLGYADPSKFKRIVENALDRGEELGVSHR